MSIFVRENHGYAPEFAKRYSKNEPGEVVSVIDKRFRVAFVVSPHRSDKRTGSTSAPRPMSPYWKEMQRAVNINGGRV